MLKKTFPSLVDKAASLAKEFSERAAKVDAAAEFPAENFQRLREEGFLKLTVPVDIGGHGLFQDGKYSDFYEILRLIASGCPSTGQLLQVHSHCVGVVSGLASPSQRAEILKPVVTEGKLIGAAGNPREGLKSGKATLRPVDGGFLMSSTNPFGSLSAVADMVMVFGLAPGEGEVGDRFVPVLVPCDVEGIRFEDTWSKAIGMRGTVTWTTHFDDVFVPWKHVLGNPGDWIQFDARSWTLAHAANNIGAAEGIVNFVEQILRQHPYSPTDNCAPGFVANMMSELFAGMSAIRSAARLWDEQRAEEAEAASLLAQNFVAQACLNIAQSAYEVCGARQAFFGTPLDRLSRDIRMYTLHTRRSNLAQAIVDSVFDEEWHSKSRFGPKTKRQSWSDYHINPPEDWSYPTANPL